MKRSIADNIALLATATVDWANDLPAEDESKISADILYRSNRRDRDRLKQLALDEHSSVQTILHEALNDLLIKRRLPPMD